jgi:hypothetical protein
MCVTHTSPVTDLATPAISSTGRAQWLRFAAACLAGDSIDRDQWLSLAAACLPATAPASFSKSKNIMGKNLTLGNSPIAKFTYNVCSKRSKQEEQSEKEREASVRGVACLIDPGSNAHLTNVRGVLVPGSVVSCYVEVQGLSGKGQSLVAKFKGKYIYKVSESLKVELVDVLFVPDAVLGSTMNEPMVLVSSGQMAKLLNIGTHFVAGGGEVEFIRDRNVVGGFDSSANRDGLYIDRRRQTNETRET